MIEENAMEWWATDYRSQAVLDLERRKGSLTRKGINHQGLWYVSREYQRIWEQRKSGEAVTVAYDPEDVSWIFLLDGLDYLPFELADSCKRYAGTTQEEACKEQEKHKIRKRELEKRDTEGRIHMIRNIQAVIEGSVCLEKGKLKQAVIEPFRYSILFLNPL